MRRFSKPLKSKITIVSRSGRKNVFIPLTVTRGDKAEGTSANSQTKPTSSSGVTDEEDRDFTVDDTVTDGENDRGLSEHARKLRNRALHWESIRESLLQANIEESASPEGQCVYCEEKCAVLRCKDCGSRQHFCLDCAITMHATRNQFHLLEIWKQNWCKVTSAE